MARMFEVSSYPGLGEKLRLDKSFSAGYFEKLYRGDSDPWSYSWKLRKSRYYEQRKYLRTYRAIPPGRYTSVLEIGCSIGVFTKLLARRSRNLLGIDFAPTALEQAKVRCERFPHVRFQDGRVPDDFPSGPFDLIVMSEVAYYLSAEDFAATCDHIVDQLIPGGYFLMVHFRHQATDAKDTGEQYHAAFREACSPALSVVRDRSTARYCLEVFQKQLVPTA